MFLKHLIIDAVYDNTYWLFNVLCWLSNIYEGAEWTGPLGWWWWGGGGGPLVFSYIRRLRSFLEVQIIEFLYFLGFSDKILFFWGTKILWIVFGFSQN